MNTRRKISTFILILLLLLTGALYLVLHNSNETITYQQSDFINYHMLTDKDIAHAPRITHDFYFESSPGDGYSPTSSITFKNAGKVKLLESYLLSLGFKKENRKMGNNEVWSKSDDVSGTLFYVSFDPTNKKATLTKSIGR